MTFFLSERSIVLTSSAISVLASVAMGSSVGAAPQVAVFIPAAEIVNTLKELSAIYTDDEPVRVVDAGAYSVGVFVVGRPKKVIERAPLAEGVVRVTEGLQLDHVAAIVRILSGRGTIVAGGTLADGHRIASDDPDLPVIGPGMRGKLIRGGERRHVDAGDIVVVPPGVAHGFSTIDQPLTYMAIRIDSAKVLPLK